MASIRERTTNGGERVWAVLFRHGKRQRSKTFATEKDAAKFKALVDALGSEQALAMNAAGQGPSGPTLRELAADWFEWKARDVEPRTIEDYRRDFTNWIDPFLGHRVAATITEGDVQTWIDRDLSRRLGPKSIADRHALLHGIYKWAAAKSRGRVPSNPCTETELPRRKKGAPKGLTLAEWYTLKAVSEAPHLPDCTDSACTGCGVGQDAADLMLFMASTGWRIGEATALTVRDVEDGDRMYVSMGQVQRKGVGVVVGAKSAAGMRRIDVLPECARMIRRRIIGKGPTDLVFTNGASPSGLWEPSTFRRRYWSKAVKAAGLEARKPTPHWLRHSHVLMCHAAGMSLPEIQRRIGHEDIQTTINVYGRMLGDVSDDVFEKLDLITSGRVADQLVTGEVVRGELD